MFCKSNKIIPNTTKFNPNPNERNGPNPIIVPNT